MIRVSEGSNLDFSSRSHLQPPLLVMGEDDPQLMRMLSVALYGCAAVMVAEKRM